MKIGYVGLLAEAGTCAMRMRALQALGHAIVPIDSQAKAGGPYLQHQLNRVCHKLGFPLDVSGVNSRLLKLVSAAPPDLVWVDEGLVLWPRTLRSLKAIAPQTVVVHYNPDDPFGRYGKAGWRIFLRALSHYDVHFVPRWQNLAEYRAHGAQRIIRAYRGFCPQTHRPLSLSASEREAFGGSVGFIGSYEAPRATALQALSRAGIAPRIWGNGWRRNAQQLPVEDAPLYQDVYVKAMNSFDINLHFLRQANRDQQSSRSYEIPACGAFMLAERTDEHCALFEEGTEAEFFSSSDELIEKVQFYLRYETRRQCIARNGRERCLRSGYDYPSRMRTMLQQALSAARG